ncbi:RNA 2',3'-cyclic phosphodiesterase [Paenibacillus glycanilyticus]|uniref:RNA 2',3'-cyclic phosphodiesterase n=1 Tax=Paenibacillus glycanilyticus TaxID=126569 RepID=UPI0020426B32|nr:RNA 2',3'-cyclic phosphodiesterase [Paenibacillus glycanilyticus]MCM3626283.1 RNA 2',3'-cyclic phosphodiesterase [Paenibacillus glycanilyticus]
MELFVAIDFHARVLNELIQIKNYLIKHDNMGIFEPTENYHLTLLYLNQLEDHHSVIDKLENIKHSCFHLQLDQLGSFENADGNVLWINVKNELEALHELQQKIKQELVSLYVPIEHSSFYPHITLSYGHKIGKETEEVFLACKINEVVIQISDFHLYEVLNTVKGKRFKKMATFMLEPIPKGG